MCDVLKQRAIKKTGESLNLDFAKIESWYNLWSMCLNPNKSLKSYYYNSA